MSASTVTVLELIAWGLDEYPFRNAMDDFHDDEMAERIIHSHELLSGGECQIHSDALLGEEMVSVQDLLKDASDRDDLRQEYKGLNWTLGVVDLRRLLSFQRRLIFDPTRQMSAIDQNDWPALVSLAIGATRSTEYKFVGNKDAVDRLDFTLYSGNPDLQFRVDKKKGRAGLSPLSLHGGSPFLEVAKLRGRWFLRDGYHRAYGLLRMGVSCVPAIVIFAQDVKELGATDPWFFNEEQLFSDRPPRVMDFLDENLVLSYKRKTLRKVIRVRIEESLEPADEVEEIQGDER